MWMRLVRELRRGLLVEGRKSLGVLGGWLQEHPVSVICTMGALEYLASLEYRRMMKLREHASSWCLGALAQHTVK